MCSTEEVGEIRHNLLVAVCERVASDLLGALLITHPATATLRAMPITAIAAVAHCASIATDVLYSPPQLRYYA